MITCFPSYEDNKNLHLLKETIKRPLSLLSFVVALKTSSLSSEILPSSQDKISTFSFFLLPLFRSSFSKRGLNLQFFPKPTMLNPYLPKRLFICHTTVFLSLSFPYYPRYFTISRIDSLVSFPYMHVGGIFIK